MSAEEAVERLAESDWALLRDAYPDSPSWPSVLSRISAVEKAREQAERRVRQLDDRHDWVDYADQLEAKLSDAERERDALREALEILLKYARPVDIQAAEIQGGVDFRAALTPGSGTSASGDAPPESIADLYTGWGP